MFQKFGKIILLFVVAGIFSVLATTLPITPDHARASGGNVTGWMWSDNIGWVSLSCNNTSSCATVDYGITQDVDGNWTGYGWSDNVGWIKFDAGCPSGTEGQCGAKLVGNNLLGWARFCAGSSDGQCSTTPRVDGWDGWVSLSSQNDHDPGVTGVQTSSYAYGPIKTGNQLSGFAWGSVVSGWLSFENVLVDPTGGASTLTLVPSTSAPTSGNIGSLPPSLYVTSDTGTIHLSWYVTDSSVTYTSCTGSSPNNSNNWNGQTLPIPQVFNSFETRSGVGFDMTVANPSNFQISCTRATGGTDVATAVVARTADCVVTLSGGGNYCPSGPNARVPQLSWFATNASSCDATWFTGSNASTHPTAGSQVVSDGSYQVTCVTQGTGNFCSSNTETVTALDPSDPVCTAPPVQPKKPKVKEK